jgi:hypothetical protein
MGVSKFCYREEKTKQINEYWLLDIFLFLFSFVLEFSELGIVWESNGKTL